MHTNEYYGNTKTGEVSARRGKRFKEGMTFEIGLF